MPPEVVESDNEEIGKPAAEEGTDTEGAGSAAFKFTAFREFLKFVEYVGEAAPVELAEPIQDTAGAMLVQKANHVRESLIKNLWKFFNAGNLNENISVAGTKALRTALRDKICHSLFKCLEPGRFHVAQALVDASQVNLRAMVAGIVERKDTLPLFLKLDQMEDPILPHLGEVAITAGGLAEQYVKSSQIGASARESIRHAVFAGLFHDIALADDADFLLKDIEQAAQSGHIEQSARFVRENLPELNPVIAQLIEHHHRDSNRYDPDVDTQIKGEQVSEEALALAEFILIQLRSQYKKEEGMTVPEMLFYGLGRAFGQGRFHPRFRSIASSLWENLYTTLHYGYEIGLVENRCPFKPSAVAYPTPRCTQIMCHQRVRQCEHYDDQFALEILNATRFPGRPGIIINPGKYGKCKLAQFLPREEDMKKGALDWMEKGGRKETPKK
ncbi:MAG: HD domain-containing protein [Turneriella sp.]|nr:HD domain-containing protein [Turneriella sp.]